jgi:ParB-like chromosome segregation protein Spo0J
MLGALAFRQCAIYPLTPAPDWPSQFSGHKMPDLLPYRLAPIESLIPYARNARTHSDEQISKLAGSIREYGFTNPVLIGADGGIIAGHGRVLAAQRLGWTEIPVLEAAHLTEAQRRAYVLADNRLALDAGWDTELLRIELGDLQAVDFDLSLTGFELGELREIILPGNETKDGGAALGETLRYQVVVDCADEADQAALLEKLAAEGRECRPLIL